MLHAQTRMIRMLGSSRGDLCAFPENVREVLAFALLSAQRGGKHPDAKPLAGLEDGGVLEVAESSAGNTYRVVYATSIGGAVYVLHAFKEKSKKGIKIRKADVDVVKARFRRARQLDDSVTDTK